MRIFITISVLTISILFYIGCRSESGFGRDTSFYKLNFGTTYSWSAEKMHPSVGSLEACTGDPCVIVYSRGTIRSQSHVSVAIASQDMKTKFQVTSTNNGSTYKVFLNDNGTLYSCTDVPHSNIFASPIELEQDSEESIPRFASGEFNNYNICGEGTYISGGPFRAVIY